MRSLGPLESDQLTFPWPGGRRNSLTIAGFLFFSVFLHALAFYIFQVKYSLVVTISPPPAQVNLLAPTTLENQSLLKWIESQDPAAIANPHEIIPANLQSVPYKPSFAAARTAPKPVDETATSIQLPSALSAVDLINASQRETKWVAVTPPGYGSKLIFSNPLSKRIKTVPPFKVSSQRSPTSLERPADFFVGVSPSGKVQYTFLQTSSGDVAVDRQAEDYLNQVEFSTSKKEMTWGVATFFWGNDRSPSQP